MVFRAQGEGGQRVIIKTTPGQRASAEERARIRHAWQFLQGLEIEGVVRALALEERDGRPALVMEDIGGVSLESLASKGRLPLAEVLNVGIRVADALGALHARRILHRDVKPSNIIVSARFERVELIDFELATWSATESEAAIGEGAGSAAYVSPEQTGRTAHSVDHRSDLYSLGVTLYQLVTGTLPFPYADRLTLIHAHLATPPEPPHERAPGVPVALSAILLRLLAKAPEERYQSAFGLRADLVCVRDALAAGEALERFEPGKADVPARLHVSHRVRGREQDRSALLEAIERAARGATELVALTGPAGIGKTALVQDVARVSAAAGRAITSGKYDQRRNLPHGGLVLALRASVRQLLTGTEEVVGALGRSLADALGPLASVAAGVIPELTLVLGETPPAPELPPVQAAHRFTLALRRLVGALAAQCRPLVLFVDDLHRAEPRSLELIEEMLGSAPGLALIAAWRGNEIQEGDPLQGFTERVASKGASVVIRPLAPLGVQAVEALVSDSLGARCAEIGKLSRELHDRTAGNPLFVGRYLRALEAEDGLRFDPAAGRWRFRSQALRDLGISDDVAELMAHQLVQLPEPTRKLLQIGAFLGGALEVELLEALVGAAPGDLDESLWTAVEAGLITGAHLDGGASTGPRHYRFTHDRVQSAAYALLSVEARAGEHLRLARALRERLDAAGQDRHLLTIADQLRQGHTGLGGDAPRREAAECLVEAGERAWRANDADRAMAYLDAGLELLGAEPWRADRGLALRIHTASGAVAQARGEPERADAIYAAASPHTADAEERSRLCCARIATLNTLGRFSDAVALGLVELRGFGFEPPDSVEGWLALAGTSIPALSVEVAALDAEQLIALPEASEEATRREMDVLVALFAPVTQAPHMLPAIVARACELTIRRGRLPDSPLALGFLGLVQSAGGQHQAGFATGELAMALARLAGPERVDGRLFFTYACFLRPWGAPISSVWPLAAQAHRVNLEQGRLDYAGWAVIQTLVCTFGSAMPLSERLARVEEVMEAFRTRLRYDDMSSMAAGAGHALARMMGGHEVAAALTAEGHSREAILPRFHEYPTAAGTVRAERLQAAWVCGAYDEALAEVSAGDPLMPAMAGSFPRSVFAFYAALTLAERLDVDAATRAARIARIAEAAEHFRGLSEACPENLLHRAELLAGVVAEVGGDPAEAWDRYEAALSAADLHGYDCCVAIASERIAGLQLSRGRPIAARGYLEEAYSAWRRWGASARAALLVEAHPWLAAGHATSSNSTRTTAQVVAGIDVSSILRATRALSREMVVEDLLRIVMVTLRDNAGAQQGALLLLQEGALRLEARLKGEGVPEVLLGTPLDETTGVAQTVVRYVERTREPVVLADATRRNSFAADPHFQGGQARSVLCLPVLNQNELLGVVYLENNLTSGAFTAERCHVLEMLAAQAAIALTNARLCDDLDRRVRARTADLQSAVRDLRAFGFTLTHDLRAPMRIVRSFSSLLAEDYAESFDDDGRLYLARILAACDRMEALIEDVLALSRVKETELCRGPVSLTQLGHEVVAALRLQSPDSKTKFVVEEALEAYADPGLVRVALENLIGNAWKFTAKEAEPVIELGAEDTPRGRAYFVRDNGIGLSQEDAEAIFEPFVRLASGHEFEGSGVGLATVRTVIERHGGSLWAIGSPGEGTTVYFTLGGD